MKKETVKKLSLISAIAVAASALSACGGSGAETETTPTTTATMKEEQAAVVEQVEVEAETLENGTLKFLSFWDINPTEGKTLFYPIGKWALYEPDLSAYGEPDEIMFVPTPRDEQADAWYLTAHGGVDAYALCKGAQNPEAVAAYIKCLLVQVNDESVQSVNEQQLREEYHWTDEMIEMDRYISELTNAHPVVDFYPAVNNDVTDLLSNAIKDSSYNGTDWYSTRESLNEAV